MDDNFRSGKQVWNGAIIDQLRLYVVSIVFWIYGDVTIWIHVYNDITINELQSII